MDNFNPALFCALDAIADSSTSCADFQTKLKRDVHDVRCCFPGYRIVLHDRVLRGGGGVALICRDEYSVSEVSSFSPTLRAWNDIPDGIKAPPSVAAFERALRAYLVFVEK